MNHARLTEEAERWARGDVDEHTRAWVWDRLRVRDWEALAEAFERPLRFGTAGLRGPVGAGPARMNLATVSRVSWALGQFLLDHAGGSKLVVVGYDARPTSPGFARRSAEVLCGLGLRVAKSAGPVPTPLVAFAVRELRAAAGIVVTASHNPPKDNGFKVYDDLGIQIVAPWDREIADSMVDAPDPSQMVVVPHEVQELSEPVVDAYFRQLEALTATFRAGASSSNEEPSREERVTIGYTPLHGVGTSFFERALRPRADRVQLVIPASQKQPDGTFPTVRFPNPEEPGALDELCRVMRSEGAEAGFAHDPDADRFALCVRHESEDRIVRLSGDEVGLLFADACLERPSEARGLVSTIVSSPIVEELARVRGARLERTLTGFKWLCRAAGEMSDFAFAYEEALGYCFAAPPGSLTVRDKDGLAAGCVATELVLRARDTGRKIHAHLLDLYEELGLWGSHGRSIRFEGMTADQESARVLGTLRSSPPVELSSFRVASVVDYLEGASERPSFLGKSDLLCFEIERQPTSAPVGPDRGKVFLRPSGTEPKLKFYIHLRTEMTDRSAHERLVRDQEELADVLFELLLSWGDRDQPKGG